jgi:hypothetical protein
MISDQNSVILSGPITRSKVWPANGKPYTNISITMVVNNQEIPVDVSVTEKQLNSKIFTIIQQKLGKENPHIVISGILAEKANKDGVKRLIIKASLTNISVQNGKRKETNFVVVSGKVADPGPTTFTVKTSYRNPKENTILERNVLVSHSLPEKLYNTLPNSFKTIVIGTINIGMDGTMTVLANNVLPELNG